MFQNETSSQLRIMNLNVQRILTAPSVRMSRRGETESQNEEDMRDVLTIPLIRCPEMLQILWTEYKFGVGGNRAAKLFTAREMRKVNFLYSLRKPFWTLVEKMICFGYSHTFAIEKMKGFIVWKDQIV